ncbi:AfsR/SARP family transcriptional regulator [Nocardia sp. CA-119907]|uniref:AfsR/SARP family transcriptional regulator n=1 Tax=Nocardia sp. CA-119907 TaxID=3239973 RepID=UPI003D991B32
MRVLLLGPFEVRVAEDRPIRIAGVKVRAFLARLAMEPGRVAPADVFADAIWAGRPPENGANALQALVSRVRRAIGTARVEWQAPGYRLVIDPVDVAPAEQDRAALGPEAFTAAFDSTAASTPTAAIEFLLAPHATTARQTP